MSEHAAPQYAAPYGPFPDEPQMSESTAIGFRRFGFNTSESKPVAMRWQPPNPRVDMMYLGVAVQVVGRVPPLSAHDEQQIQRAILILGEPRRQAITSRASCGCPFIEARFERDLVRLFYEAPHDAPVPIEYPDGRGGRDV